MASASAELRVAGISIRDQFVSPAEMQALIACARARQARGEFVAARVGGKHLAQRRADIRGDFTCWLREPLESAERTLLQQLERLRLDLNQDAYLGLFDLELHYANYPPGSSYSRHVDQPQAARQRIVSMVLYLNLNWQKLDGGALRIHRPEQQFLDVEPLGGRLVCFLSAGCEHEVLAARRERLSISGWFTARD
jgi:SM-20-related protein